MAIKVSRLRFEHKLRANNGEINKKETNADKAAEQNETVKLSPSKPGDKRRRRSSDDGNEAQAQTQTVDLISTRKFHKRPTRTHSTTTRGIGASTTYSPNLSSKTSIPNRNGTDLERAQHRWYRQKEAANLRVYLDDEYIKRARQDSLAAGEPDELKTLVTAAEEMRDRAMRDEREMSRKRMEMGDTSRFVDLGVVGEPVVVKMEVKRGIRKRAREILRGKGKGEGDAGNGEDDGDEKDEKMDGDGVNEQKDQDDGNK